MRLQIFSNSFNSWSDLWKLWTINMIRVWIAVFGWLWLIFHVVSICNRNHFYSVEFSNQRLYFLTYEQRNPVMFALQSRARNMNIVLFRIALLLAHSIRLLPHHWLRFGIDFLFRQHASKSCIELSVWPPLACLPACLPEGKVEQGCCVIFGFIPFLFVRFFKWISLWEQLVLNMAGQLSWTEINERTKKQNWSVIHIQFNCVSWKRPEFYAITGILGIEFNMQQLNRKKRKKQPQKMLK